MQDQLYMFKNIFRHERTRKLVAYIIFVAVVPLLFYFAIKFICAKMGISTQKFEIITAIYFSVIMIIDFLPLILGQPIHKNPEDIFYQRLTGIFMVLFSIYMIINTVFKNL